MNSIETYSLNPEIQQILIQTMNYRQGSIVALVKQNGTVSERYSYDAWGRRRNPANWADYNVPAPRLISRGYTGHEMLDCFGLINMNGRMYDPVIGRVLSPDNYVQDPTNTQSFNRYSYCLNNPLRYTDPSGWLSSADWAEYYENKANSEFAFLAGVGFRSNPSYSDNGGGGGGQGWGGVGGVLPQGIDWMPRDITIDDLVSLNDATPSDGEAYTYYSTVNGDWYKDPAKYLIYQTAVLNADGKFVGNGHFGVIKEGVMHSDGTYPTFDSYNSASNFINGFKSNIGNNFSGGGGYLVNPTGLGIRNDAGGAGHWGASRGNRSHYGLDFQSVDGQNIVSPVSGRAMNSSFVNKKGITIPTVVIIPSDQSLGFNKLEILYTGPVQGGWRTVNAGDVIGQSVNLQSLGYPSNVGPHIHLQMKLDKTPINPTPYFKFK
jgi:RHS repeat-associated protein